MVRFSCFNTQVPIQKQKKHAQPSFDTLLKRLHTGSQTPSLVSSLQDAKDENHDSHDEQGQVMHRRKSEEINSNYCDENSSGAAQIGSLRRTRSLGSELDKEGGIMEDLADEECSCDGSRDYAADGLTPLAFDMSELRISSPDDLELSISVHPQIVSDEFSVLPVEGLQNPGKDGHDNHDTPTYIESAGDSGSRTPPTPPTLARSSSMPDFGSVSPTSMGHASCIDSVPRRRSFEDLCDLDAKGESIFVHEADAHVQGEGDGNTFASDKYTRENVLSDEFGYYDCGMSGKDWIIPVNDEIETAEDLQGSSYDQWGQLRGEDLKMKRIEEWVVDLQNLEPIEEGNETPTSHTQLHRGSSSGFLNGVESAKMEVKINPGMEAAKKYISTLNPTASTAHLANHGLAVIPFLSAFVSLKVLNLSGNSIARITAGALPRGLHMLNLSKNKISTIEGLRELTRLRVLDLSYNKIVRIGHGLGACSSLKELYLAGNKISEVEGLHRLLKLTILDLRFNKISTSKCLGQLAANYNSLQAISLEGNPAQKNVGDDQLKKHLLGLLPHLVYYNRHPVKSSKETGDRLVRLPLPSHQHDRFPRSDHKSSRRGSHGIAASLKHTTSSVDSPKRSRGKQGHLPPRGIKGTHHQHHEVEFGTKGLSSRSDMSLHKSRSMGSLAAL